MRPFDLATEWEVQAPLPRVWAVLLNPLGLAARWPRVSGAGTGPAGPLRKGNRFEWTVRAPYGFRLRFETTVTEVDPFRTIRFVAHGDLQGSGECRLEPVTASTGGRTRLAFGWNVVPRPWKVQLLSNVPGGRLLLRRGHDRVMQGARRALEDSLTAGAGTI